MLKKFTSALGEVLKRILWEGLKLHRIFELIFKILNTKNLKSSKLYTKISINPIQHVIEILMRSQITHQQPNPTDRPSVR